MSDFRQIHTRIYTDDWFSTLEPDAKFLFIYLFSNSHVSVSGLYELPVRIMAFETGLEQGRVLDLLGKFSEEGKAYYEDGVVWVPGIPKYQGNAGKKLKEKYASDARKIKDCQLKNKYLDFMAQMGNSALRPVKKKTRNSASQGLARKRLLETRGSRCELCGKVGYVELHHKVRAADGGSFSDDNLILLCVSCHKDQNRKQQEKQDA